MSLLLDIDGAADEQWARGIAAASAVFAAADVTSQEAAAGHFGRSGWAELGFPGENQLSASELRAVSVGDEAEQAALEACCAAWSANPPGARLVVELEEGDYWRNRFVVRLMQLLCSGTNVAFGWNEIAADLWPAHRHHSPESTAETYASACARQRMRRCAGP